MEQKSTPNKDEALDLIRVPKPTLLNDLQRVINQHSRENASHTPDFLLAEYLLDCLTAYERIVNARAEYWNQPKDFDSLLKKSSDVAAEKWIDNLKETLSDIEQSIQPDASLKIKVDTSEVERPLAPFQQLDEKGFVFLDDRNMPFWVAMYYGEPWMFYWHPDNQWVTLRKLNQVEIWSMATERLPDEQAEHYHKLHEKHSASWQK